MMSSNASRLLMRTPLALFGAVMLGSASASAQLAVPAVQNGTFDSNAVVTAAEMWHRVQVREAATEVQFSFRDVHFPIDSMLTATATNAQVWLRQLKQRPINGMQLDPGGAVAEAGFNEADAKALIAKRLATPGLPLQDRAYTYVAAIEAFSNWHYPDRLAIAETYLRDLDALGERAAPWQFMARMSLSGTYYQLGRSADVARVGTQAVHRFATMPYLERWYGGVEWYYVAMMYMQVVEAIGAQPNAHARILALNDVLLGSVTPTPATLAANDARTDSVFTRDAQWQKKWIQQWLTAAAMIGTEGKPWISNYWLNRPTRDSADIPVNDGKIRIVISFPYTCNGCLEEAFALTRVKQRYPDIDVLGITTTMGTWANRLVSADEEAQHLTNFFLNQLKLTYPVGIWKAPKILHGDGGETPDHDETGDPTNPNQVNYPQVLKSTVWVLDGQGRIREVEVGAGTVRDTEDDLNRTIAFLEAEAAHDHGSTHTS